MRAVVSVRVIRAAIVAGLLHVVAVQGTAWAATTANTTIHRLAPDAEERNREQREAWLEGMHRAAPGVNWREIEAANAMETFLLRESAHRVTGGAWTEVGASNVTGRTHVTVLAPNGSDLLIGTDLGGLWSGAPSGGPWSPRSDQVGAGVHHLVITPGLPEVWLGATNGGRFFYSTDAGATWHVPTGLADEMWGCVRLIQEPGSRRVYAMIEGRRWIGTWEYSYQLYRSSDGGMSFTWLRSYSLSTRPDLWMDRAAAGKPLFLMVGSLCLRSTDFGTSFTAVGATPLAGDRVVLAGSEQATPVLYAALRVSNEWKLYRSADAGATWSFRSNLLDFWETLCASRSNANVVFYGGVNGKRSVNGGTSFSTINDWSEYYGNPTHKLHADVMGIDDVTIGAFEAVFFNTDGGTFVSYDLGGTFTNLTQNGFGNSQYYGILTSRNDSRRIAAGSQDQGYQLSTPAPGSPLAFSQIISGDYAHLTSGSGTHDLLWSVYPGFILLQVAEGSTSLEYPGFPPGVGNHSWLPNILADPADPSRLYFCADRLWTVQRTAPGSYSYTMLPQSFVTVSGEYLTAFAISPANSNYWYAATDQGALWYSHDSGSTWTRSASPGPAAHYFHGTDLLPSPTNPAVCYVGGSGYSNPAVYRTVDGGVSWTGVGTGMPGTLVFGLAFSNAFEQTLYAATEAGPFRLEPGSETWTNLLTSDCCAPLTTYWDVEAVPHDPTMRFATYGRGIWDFATGSIVDATTAPLERGLSLAVYPSPAHEQATMEFSLAAAGHATLEVVDIAGRRVATPASGDYPAGTHRVAFDLRATNGRPLGNGIYLVRVSTAAGSKVSKLYVAR